MSAAERGRETREAATRGEGRRKKRGRGEKEQREKCKNVFHYTRSKSVRISRLGFPASRFTLDDRRRAGTENVLDILVDSWIPDSNVWIMNRWLETVFFLLD